MKWTKQAICLWDVGSTFFFSFGRGKKDSCRNAVCSLIDRQKVNIYVDGFTKCFHLVIYITVYAFLQCCLTKGFCPFFPLQKHFFDLRAPQPVFQYFWLRLKLNQSRSQTIASDASLSLRFIPGNWTNRSKSPHKVYLNQTEPNQRWHCFSWCFCHYHYKSCSYYQSCYEKKVKVTFSKQDYTSLTLPESHQLCSIYHANVNSMRTLTGC